MTLKLRPRELDYVSHLARGLTMKEVAEVENVSRFTINTTLQLARARAGARNTPHLVAMAIAEGLVKP